MKKKLALIFAVIFTGGVVLSGCSGNNVSQEEYEAMSSSVSYLSKEKKSLEDENGNLNKKIADLQEQNGKLEDRIEALEQMNKTLEADLEAYKESEVEAEQKNTNAAETVEPEKKTESSEKSSSSNRNLSDLELNGQNVIETVIADMKEYDYIKDVYIEADESKNDISIVVQVTSATDESTAKMAGEDVVRYLAACASFANSYFSSPGSDNLGSLYDKYDLLLYVDDGYENLKIYGAKVTTAKKITWR